VIRPRAANKTILCERWFGIMSCSRCVYNKARAKKQEQGEGGIPTTPLIP
jgi:hypothetical protein